MQTYRTIALQTMITLVFGAVLLHSGLGWAAPVAKEVEVVNDLSNPVPIEDVDNPARQPFQTSVFITSVSVLDRSISCSLYMP